MPTWLERRLRANLERSQSRMRRTGERNPYVSPETDPDRFLRRLRLGAGVAALLVVGLVIALVVR